MKFKLLFYGLLALAIPAETFAGTLYDGSSNAFRNAVILVIRHAEPNDGDGLSSAGYARAKAYANYFKNFTIDGRPLKLDYLFAAADSQISHRPRLTIEPTALELGLTIDTGFRNRQFLELVDEMQSRPHGRNILICWHHGEVPQLLRALGADPRALLPNGRWPNDVFDWVIELRYDESGELAESKRIDEKLSPDDPGHARL
jgi:broad specificity phosphatase PhoE